MSDLENLVMYDMYINGYDPQQPKRHSKILGREALMKVTIYTKANCVYCDYARNLLEHNKIDYNKLTLDEDFTRENLLELFPSARSFPVIVVDGFNIGG